MPDSTHEKPCEVSHCACGGIPGRAHSVQTSDFQVKKTSSSSSASTERERERSNSRSESNGVDLDKHREFCVSGEQGG
jgi:hypothetical protein